MAWISLSLQGDGRAGVKLDATKGTHQPRSHFVQFARVIAGELMKDLAAFPGQTKDGATLVAIVDGSLNEIFALGSIH